MKEFIKKYSKLIAGIFIVLIGSDIYFSRPFITRGTVVPPFVGILFGLWGLLMIYYEIRRLWKSKEK